MSGIGHVFAEQCESHDMMDTGQFFVLQWRSQGGGGHGGHGPPPKLLVVNFPINLRCYVLLGCRVINVIHYTGMYTSIHQLIRH